MILDLFEKWYLNNGYFINDFGYYEKEEKEYSYTEVWIQFRLNVHIPNN